MPYSEFNHPKYENLEIQDCYLCGKKLDGVINKDHVIPDTMFPKGAPNRPKLPVHKSCNSGKSMRDERAKMRVLLMSSLNPIAGEKLLNDLLIPANQQHELVGLVGQSNSIRDYKLARTLAKDVTKQGEIVHNGTELVQVATSDTHAAELDIFFSDMARGLYKRNIIGSDPAPPKLTYIDRRTMRLSGEDPDKQMKLVVKMIQAASQAGSLFGQIWEEHFGYVGSESSDVRNGGFIWLDFYDGFGVYAFFSPHDSPGDTEPS